MADLATVRYVGHGPQAAVVERAPANSVPLALQTKKQERSGAVADLLVQGYLSGIACW